MLHLVIIIPKPRGITANNVADKASTLQKNEERQHRQPHARRHAMHYFMQPGTLEQPAATQADGQHYNRQKR